jgi:hypothetical protein
MGQASAWEAVERVTAPETDLEARRAPPVNAAGPAPAVYAMSDRCQPTLTLAPPAGEMPICQ